MNTLLCEDCLYWHKRDDRHGQCRRDPPDAALIPQQGIGGTGLAVISYWAETTPGDWCGAARARNLTLVKK